MHEASDLRELISEAKARFPQTEQEQKRIKEEKQEIGKPWFLEALNRLLSTAVISALNLTFFYDADGLENNSARFIAEGADGLIFLISRHEASKILVTAYNDSAKFSVSQGFWLDANSEDDFLLFVDMAMTQYYWH